jgi:citrate synthase
MKKPRGPAKTNISTSTPTSITVRGRDLVNDLIGNSTFTEMTYFLITNRMPTSAETRVLDACFVTLMEHGWTPAAVITRMMLNAVPDQTQVAMAAGLLAVGSVNVGTMEGCAKLLTEGMARGGDLDAWCLEVVTRFRANKEPIPGFGHSYHVPDDPRPPRLFAVAKEAGLKGDYIALLQRLSGVMDREYGRHITINATGAIGALLLEIGLPSTVARGIAVISRAGGLVGHILEEMDTAALYHLPRVVKEQVPYEAPPQTA